MCTSGWVCVGLSACGFCNLLWQCITGSIYSVDSNSTLMFRECVIFLSTCIWIFAPWTSVSQDIGRFSGDFQDLSVIFVLGDVQWLDLMSSEKALGLNPTGPILCWVYMFSLCLCGFPATIKTHIWWIGNSKLTVGVYGVPVCVSTAGIGSSPLRLCTGNAGIENEWMDVLLLIMKVILQCLNGWWEWVYCKRGENSIKLIEKCQSNREKSQIWGVRWLTENLKLWNTDWFNTICTLTLNYVYVCVCL